MVFSPVLLHRRHHRVHHVQQVTFKFCVQFFRWQTYVFPWFSMPGHRDFAYDFSSNCCAIVIHTIKKKLLIKCLELQSPDNEIFLFFFYICFSGVFIPHGKTFDVHLDTSVPQEYCGKMWWSESSSLPLPPLQTLLYLTLWYDCWSPHKGVKTEKLVPFFCIWQDTIFGT